MKKKALAAIFIAMGVLAGCGNDVPSPVQTFEADPVATAPAAPVETPAPTPEQVGFKVITDRKVVDGKKQSYLTGEWKDEAVVNRRGMAVMIPNNKPSLPQYGISLASIVFEAPMESGSCTRLMGIFEDYDELKRIGPVRSARDYFMYESMAYEAIYCNWGLAVPYVGPIINTDEVDNISQAVSGIDKPSTIAFDRVDRGSGYSTEFTGYLFTDGYTKSVANRGYSPNYTDRFVQSFTFADDGCRAEYEEYPSATKVIPGGTKGSADGYSETKPYFTYNADDGLYYRTQLNAPQKDEYNGEQIAVSNVVFKVCHGEVRDDHGYLAFGVHGTGDAYVFTNGRVIKGTWQRDSNYDPNLFLDEKGEEIVFNQGKTWICIIWDKYQDTISYE